MIKVNDVELNFDVMDAVQLENYDEALQDIKNASIKKGLTTAQRIREYCDIVKNFFDKTCGAQTAERIFGDSYNYRKHFEALDSFIEQVGKEAKKEQQAIDDRIAKYTLNRAQRRAKK